MARCWKCGGIDMAPLLGDKYQCNDDGYVTDASTGRGPAEGLYSNNDMLASESLTFMQTHHPEEYRLIADTVAGQPDPGTKPGGEPLSDTDATPEDIPTIGVNPNDPTEPEATEPEAPMEPEAPAEEPTPEPEAPTEPAPEEVPA